MFQRILVPLDGSERAAQALPVAARIARATGGTLILLVSLPVDDWGWQEAPLLTPEIQRAEREKMVADLDRLASSSEIQGIEVVQKVIPGNPAETILEMTQAHQSDIVVMCSHGRTGIKRWALGSVAQKVARHSEVPVLILKAHEPMSLPPQGTRALRVMVALDGSSLAESTLLPAGQLSMALSAPHAGELRLVRVLPFASDFDYGQADAVAKIRQEGRREAQAYLQEVKQRLLEQPLAHGRLLVTTALATSLDIAETLISIAETGEGEGIPGITGGCDILALATHGRSGPARWVLGSITERVLEATHLPLFIIRPQLVGETKSSA